MKINKNSVIGWFGGKLELLEYFETKFKQNTMGNGGKFTTRKQYAQKFNLFAKDEDRQNAIYPLGEMVINAFLASPKGKRLSFIPFEYMLDEHKEEILEGVCEGIQNLIHNDTFYQKLNPSSISTPNFSVNVVTTDWLLSDDVLGIIAKNTFNKPEVNKYEIVGDEFAGKMITRDDATGEIVLHQWDNVYLGEELGKDLGEFVSLAHAIIVIEGSNLTGGKNAEKFDYVVVSNDKGNNQVWRFNGGIFDNEDNWDRIDTKNINGNRYLVYKDYLLAGSEGRPGIQGPHGNPGKDAVGIKDIVHDKVNDTLKFTFTDGTEKSFAVIGGAGATEVYTAGAMSDVDLTKRDVIYFVDSMSSTDVTTEGYTFKDGEKAMVTINSTGDMVMHPFVGNVWKSLAEDIQSVEDDVVRVEKQVTKNTEALKNVSGSKDYTGLNQKEVYDKIIADALNPGAMIKVDSDGKQIITTVSGLNTGTSSTVLTFEASWYEATFGKWVSETRFITIDGTSATPLPKGERGIEAGFQLRLFKKAEDEREVVRLKELREMLLPLQGGTFVIRGASFNKGLADLLDHLKIAVPAGYATWLEAINTEVGFDRLFDDKGAWLTTPRAQWAKTHIFDIVPSKTTTEPIGFNISFRGYKPDGTLSDDKDQLLAIANTGVDQKILVKEFMALTLYQTSDTQINNELQKKLDSVDGTHNLAGFQISNIIKQSALAAFEDGTPVTQQKGVANSQKEQKVIDDKQDEEIAKKQTIPTNDNTAKVGQIQSFVAPGISTWIDAPQSGPGAPVFELLSRYDVHPNDATWTEINGTTGTRHAFYLNKSNPIMASHVSTIGGESYQVNSESLASGNNKQFVVFETDITNTKSNTIRFSGEMIGGYYTHTSISQTGQDVVLQLLWDYYNNRQGNTIAQLNAAGLSQTYIAQYKWEGVTTDLTTLGATPRPIAATSHPWATNQALSKYQFYEVKSGGKYKLIAMFKNLTQITGGLVGMITGALLEDSDETHNTAAGGNAGAMAKSIASLSASVTKLTNEKHNVPTNDGTATAGQFLARGANGQESEWKDLPAAGGTPAGTFTHNSDKLVANDLVSTAPAFIGLNYKGGQYYGTGATGIVSIGNDASGIIQIGSTKNDAHKAENKLIQGTKSATFEQIIDAAHAPSTGGTPLTKTITLVFDDGTTEDIKVG